MNKTEILNRTNGGFDILRYYLGSNIQIGRKFRNPFYEDTKASCSVYYDRRGGIYRFKDFGNDDFSGDCFDVAARVYNLSCKSSQDFVELLKTIDRDLGLGLSDATAPSPNLKQQLRQVSNFTTPPKLEQRPYSFKEKPFSPAELAFWGQSGIGLDTLARYNVISLAEFTGTNQAGVSYTIRSTAAEPMFGYRRKAAIKAYRPKSKSRFLFGGAVEENYCFGLEQLPATGDTLFITGGEKDVMTLAARGYAAVCFNSESARIHTILMDELASRFGRIVLLYDTDAEGLKYSLQRQEELKPYNAERVVLPLAGTKQEKDVTDYFRLGHSPGEFDLLYKRPEIRRAAYKKKHKLNI